ncbi:hypothetical protein V1Y59_18020 [Gordonia sp. PKS22-38]|uniref:Uncharacterized protein n=1 Tax=Gordonia prachuapensis TaxID=3115651 RepID=A0ABU7MXF5_9ACTN|nr:hypothetical protein [Gordonia sp. PKS22-38]
MPDLQQPTGGDGRARDLRENVLVIIVGLVGTIATLALTTVPVLADVAYNAPFAIFVGAVNTCSYLGMVMLATQSPLRWELVRDLGLLVVIVSAIAAVWAVTAMDPATAGTAFLLAMSGLMGLVVLIVCRLVAAH